MIRKWRYSSKVELKMETDEKGHLTLKTVPIRPEYKKYLEDTDKIDKPHVVLPNQIEIHLPYMLKFTGALSKFPLAGYYGTTQVMWGSCKSALELESIVMSNAISMGLNVGLISLMDLFPEEVAGSTDRMMVRVDNRTDGHYMFVASRRLHRCLIYCKLGGFQHTGYPLYSIGFHKDGNKYYHYKGQYVVVQTNTE